MSKRGVVTENFYKKPKGRSPYNRARAQAQLLAICASIVPTGSCTIGQCRRAVLVIKNQFNTDLNEDDCVSRATLRGLGGNENEVAFDDSQQMAQGIVLESD
ncbi:unnamed protein product [Adineta ricciae]|uniref:Uncharacterized protein n=1 Tax=Adineta ricciae TaxID=249248 RepID=A0A814PYG3_ADIRI|nr:unnamed protein product [Adineta ricciae]CAF1568701.1 unnamed protein product [Adineta ricciae]